MSYIYEVRDHLGRIEFRCDNECEAVALAIADDGDTVICRQLEWDEDITFEDALNIIGDLELVDGVPKTVIANALGISRTALNNWIKKGTGRIYPSQKLALLDLKRAFI